jgi:anthranilate phosphoribosyltransferase
LSGRLKPVLAKLADGARLSAEEAEAAFAVVMEGAASDAQIAAMLTAMHVRGETAAELAGAARAMRARMQAIAAPPGAIDVCGTGGDGFGTLNVSTAVAFVVAGCGVPVAKHGNRAISSRSGAHDVLGELGVPADLPFDQLAPRLAEGLVFLFAPRHHPASRHAAQVRADLGFRTIFNLVGPLANPACVARQLTGVYSPAWTAPMAETLGALGSERAWVVHGMGLDELTLAGPSQVAEWHEGSLREFTVAPAEAGLRPAPLDAIRGGDAAQNAAALLALLHGAASAYRDTVLLNAAAALIVAGRAGDLREGAALAAASIDAGAALHTLERARRPLAVLANAVPE